MWTSIIQLYLQNVTLWPIPQASVIGEILGLLVDSEIDLPHYQPEMVTPAVLQQDVVNRDHLSTSRYQQRPIIKIVDGW